MRQRGTHGHDSSSLCMDPISEPMFSEASLHCGEFVNVFDGDKCGGCNRAAEKMWALSTLVQITVFTLCQLAITYRALHWPRIQLTYKYPNCH
jgi:hypothetical protein